MTKVIIPSHNQSWNCQVGVRGDNVVVLAVEKKSVAKLQVDRTMRKICSIDNHVFIAFAGLTADARILIDRAKTECQSHKLTVEDRVSLEYITRYIAQLKQKYTQSNGKRPFGISALITGFDEDGTPRLFQTDPSGKSGKSYTYHQREERERDWLIDYEMMKLYTDLSWSTVVSYRNYKLIRCGFWRIIIKRFSLDYLFWQGHLSNVYSLSTIQQAFTMNGRPTQPVEVLRQ